MDFVMEAAIVAAQLETTNHPLRVGFLALSQEKQPMDLAVALPNCKKDFFVHDKSFCLDSVK
jgi:hypothetical protein